MLGKHDRRRLVVLVQTVAVVHMGSDRGTYLNCEDRSQKHGQ